MEGIKSILEYYPNLPTNDRRFLERWEICWLESLPFDGWRVVLVLSKKRYSRLMELVQDYLMYHSKAMRDLFTPRHVSDTIVNPNVSQSL